MDGMALTVKHKKSLLLVKMLLVGLKKNENVLLKNEIAWSVFAAEPIDERSVGMVTLQNVSI